MRLSIEEKFGAVAAISIVSLFAGAAFGWGWNIVKLVSMSFDPLTGMAVARVIGVFVPPVGAICGYL